VTSILSDTKHLLRDCRAEPGEVPTSYNGVDISLLPPCRENVEGGLEICWTNANLMPRELVDIITGPLNPSSCDMRRRSFWN